ncbi:GNAT family N-acetyltransferase [Oryzobacter sp. R7]|uniref:GNAT family N-acetyltransferase n=1 Tax=Oryzobacter faecalis TaxID=3388656 RepID=UPI00398D30CC
MAEPVVLDDVAVVRVTEANWRTYRDVRLAALIDSPRAFWTTYPQAAERSDERWLDLVVSGPATWLALDGGRPLGTVGLWHGPDQPEDVVALIGMWVATVARGAGVAELLVRTALRYAAAEGYARVVLDVADENGRAGAFYERLGFRATGATGSMPWDRTVTERELALDLPVR